MQVRWPIIRRAFCWCLAFSLLTVVVAVPAAERNPQVVSGKISLPADVTRVQGADDSAVNDHRDAAVDPGKALPKGDSGPQLQVVSGKITLPEDVARSEGSGNSAVEGHRDAAVDPGPGSQVVRQKIALPQMETAEAPAPPVQTPAATPVTDSETAAPTAPPPAPGILPPLTANKGKLETIYSYNPEGKIDPFEPLFRAKPKVVEKKEKKQRPKRVPRTPLEMVDISQLKLSAIITAPSGNRALVEEASGKGYVIRVGTPIGIHWGEVAEIKIDRVIVEEEVENLMGDYVKRNREMKLNKPTGE